MGLKGVLGAGLAIAGGAAAAALFFQFADISRIAWKGIETEGTVVGQSLRSSGTRTAHAPIVSFTDRAGRQHRVEGRIGVARQLTSRRTTHATGRQITVSYLPERPEDAVIRGFRQHWLFLVWALLAACLLRSVSGS